MTQLHIDIETYCDLDIKQTNVYRYVESPEFEVMMAAWALDDDPVEVAVGYDEILEIPGLWDRRVEKVAHNAAFERVSFSRVAYLFDDTASWPTFIDPESYLDTMAIAGELGLPQSLDKLTKALGSERKSAGTLLINFFCKPNRKGLRNRPEDHPEKWAQFLEYCRQDVVSMRDALRMMGGWPTRIERRIWEADQRINDRGIRVDIPMVKAGVAAVDLNTMSNEIELMYRTKITSPGSQPQLLGWLQDQGLKSMKDLRSETVSRVLAAKAVNAGTEKAENVKKVLELRQELALTSGDKYKAVERSVSHDRRLRGQFRFFGAHTGRWSGKGVQLHNLTRADLSNRVSDEEVEAAAGPGATKAELEAAKDHLVNVITDGAIVDLKLGTPTDSETLKRLVRKMFIVDGVVVDYSAIEARCVAWEAGEEWVLQAFREGRDIYVETAKRMGQVLNKEFTRYEGKVAVLALGYNGGINSLRAMGGRGTDEELQQLVQAFRQANPHIVRLWAIMDNAFKFGGPVGHHMRVEIRGQDRLLHLPSGRAIVYRNVKLNESFRYKLDDGTWKHKTSTGFEDNQGMRTMTYGGRLTENATQAIARDILAEALVRLEDAGYPVVGHVHDEVLVEESRDVEGVKKLMTILPEWAHGLPINGEGFTCYRYKKG